jgi:hypothetical protein
MAVLSNKIYTILPGNKVNTKQRIIRHRWLLCPRPVHGLFVADQ